MVIGIKLLRSNRPKQCDFHCMVNPGSNPRDPGKCEPENKGGPWGLHYVDVHTSTQLLYDVAE